MLARSRCLASMIFSFMAAGCSDESSTETRDDGGAGNGAPCNCNTQGVTFEPLTSACDSWGDANQCSGWASAYCATRTSQFDGGIQECDTVAAAMSFADGSEFTGYNCTIRIHCP